MADITGLIIKIGADASEFINALGKIEGGAKNFGTSLASAAKAGAAALLSTATAVELLTLNIAQQVEQTDILSQKTGISVRTLQEWSVIMAENSFDAQSLATAMKKLSQNIVEVNDPTKDAAALFAKIGITATTTEQTILDLADKFKAMADGPEKARLAVELFGKSGLDMIPILNRGAEAFKASREAAFQYGLVLSRDDVQAMKAVDDASDNMGQALKGLQTQFAAAFAGWVKEGIDAITNAIKNATQSIKDLRGILGQDIAGKFQEELGHGIVEPLIKAEKEFAAFKAEQRKWLAGIAESKMALFRQSADTDAIFRKMDQQVLGDVMLKKFAMVNEIIKKLGVSWEVAFQLSLGRHQSEVDLIVAKGKAEEALGKTQKQIIDSAKKANSEQFAADFENGKTILAMQQEKIGYLVTGQYEQAEATQGLIEEAEMLLEINGLNRSRLSAEENIGRKIQETASVAYAEEREAIEKNRQLRDAALKKQLEGTSAVAGLQTIQTRTGGMGGLFGEVDEARMQNVKKVLLGFQAEQNALDDLKEDYRDYPDVVADVNRQIVNLDLRRETEIRQAVGQTKTFWEEQLDAIANSNAFSISQITTTWTSGIANMIVKGGNLVQAWEATQVLLVQAALNTGIQLLAKAASNAIAEVAITEAKERAKTAIVLENNAERVTAEEASAAASAVSWQGATTSAMAMMGTVGAAIKTFFMETVIPAVVAAGEAIVGFLSAVAEAMMDTIFGIPIGIAILAGVAAIIGTLAALKAVKLAEGGIVSSPTFAMIGEAGPEAVIPLKGRDVGGSMQHVTIEVPLHLNGREIARATARYVPSAYRWEGAPA